MEIQMNEGYIIIDSIYIGGSGFVLGVSSSIPNMYVTWEHINGKYYNCLLYTSPSPRDYAASRMPSSA